MVEGMGGMKKFVGALLVVAAALSVFQGPARAELKYIGVKVGEPAPDFSLKTLDGRTVKLSSFEGKKVVLLDFWATWCNICKRELPKINKDYKKYRDRGYEVLSIVLNDTAPRRIRRLRKEKKLEFPILIDSNERVSSLYGLEGPIPVIVVIDVKGIVRFTHFGGFPPGENEIPYVLEELLTELPNGASAEKQREDR